MALADDVVKHHAAVTMDRRDHVLGRAQAGDDDWNLVLDAHLHVMLETIVALMDDLIHRKRRYFKVRIGISVCRQFPGNAC